MKEKFVEGVLKCFNNCFTFKLCFEFAFSIQVRSTVGLIVFLYLKTKVTAASLSISVTLRATTWLYYALSPLLQVEVLSLTVDEVNIHSKVLRTNQDITFTEPIKKYTLDQ